MPLGQIALALVLGVPGALPPQSWSSRVSELRLLLEKGRFAELDVAMDTVQRQFERGETTEDEPWAMLQVFLDNDQATERALSAWVVKSPDSYAALAARGLYYESTGFSIRGTTWVKDVTSGQMRRMNAMHAKAEIDCERAVTIRPVLVACHVALINIAKAASDATRAWNRYAAARVALPASALVATAYLETLTPRWGGSYADMERFLRGVEGGPLGQTAAGKALLGHVLADQAWGAAIDKDYARAIELYAGAIAKGGGSAAYFAGRGVNAAKLGRDQDALRDYDRAIGMAPLGWPYSEAKLAPLLASRARLRHLAGQQAQAEADIRDALVLSPQTLWIQKLSQEIAGPTLR